MREGSGKGTAGVHCGLAPALCLCEEDQLREPVSRVSRCKSMREGLVPAGVHADSISGPTAALRKGRQDKR